jgi:ABC-type sugar transport system permease subunit
MATTAETAAAGAPAGLSRKPSWRSRTREFRFALLLLVPSVIVVFGIVIYPILRTLYTSFYDVNSPFPGTYPFVGFDNYTQALGNPDFWSAVRRTAYFTVVSTSLELVFGLAIAMLLAAPLRARWLFRSIVVLPWALPTIVNGALWRYVFNAQYGVLNAILTQLGFQDTYHTWLNSQTFALNAVIFADVWKNTSLVAFILLAGLTTIPKELYEAARVDGVSAWQAFLRITLPMLKPAIVVVLVLRTIEAFKVFDIIYVMTRGGPANGTQSVALYTYQQAFSNELFGYGAALAYLIVVFIAVFAIIYMRAIRSEDTAMGW